MMAYLLILLLAAAILGAMWLTRLRGPHLTIVAATLAFGAAGYALAGRPALDGDPRAEQQARAPMPLTGARRAFFGQFDFADQWIIIAEGYAARGETRDAAGVIRSGLRESPRNLALWTMYGNALTDHAGGLNPAAEFAFARAEELGPEHPGPRFFRALAQARSGQVDPALATWRELLEELPEDAAVRPLIEQGIATFQAPGNPQSSGT
ncbi:tetratricopeptide repeat protein [Sphingomicrobium flavum]|uniref:tetratricopeptide repeat protein n=1 Tax=Sphingomicrobium flavum TaxID=1229164 RepID=UPI0021ADF8D9|nr:cytochrome C biosynthesis protein [Sphingomicrobium flavum]